MGSSITDRFKRYGRGPGSSSSYRVEISKWDDKENFFVEEAMLDWNETDRKTIAMRSAIRLDSVLFVRLIRPLGGGTGFPVPYRRPVKVTGNYLSPRLTVKRDAQARLTVRPRQSASG